MRDLQTVGIMFDAYGDDPFPRVKDVPYSWSGNLWGNLWGNEDPIGDRFVVARDPRSLGYPCDESAQAMDETNWSVIVGEESDIPAAWMELSGLEWTWSAWRDLEDVEGAPVAMIGNLLTIDPADAEQLDLMLSYRRALSDYPLLDESAYLEREAEAWWAYAGDPDQLGWDVIRELETDEETDEAIIGAWPELANMATKYLHYENGFTGEHEPPFQECLATAVIDALSRTFTGYRSE